MNHHIFSKWIRYRKRLAINDTQIKVRPLHKITHNSTEKNRHTATTTRSNYQPDRDLYQKLINKDSRSWRHWNTRTSILTVLPNIEFGPQTSDSSSKQQQKQLNNTSKTIMTCSRERRPSSAAVLFANKRANRRKKNKMARAMYVFRAQWPKPDWPPRSKQAGLPTGYF